MIHVRTLLKILINTYFLKSRCLFLISDNVNIFQQNNFIPFVNLKSELSPGKLFRNYGCRDIIIDCVNSQEIFQTFEYLIRFQSERYNHRRYIILWQNHTETSIRQLFQIEQFNYVSDVLLITKQRDIQSNLKRKGKYRYFYDGKNDEIYQFFTHQFGGNERPRKLQLLDEWFSKNSSFRLNNHLFPNKLGNMLGKDYRIATFNYRPYAVVDRDRGIYDGAEMRLVFEFAKKYNMTPKFIHINDNDWGDVYPNGTGGGILGNIAMGQADVGFGAIYLWEKFYTYMDFSRNFIRAGMTAIAPAPIPAAGWSIPLLPFTANTWGTLAATFILCTFALFLALIFEKSQKNADNLVAKFVYSSTVLTRLYLLQSINKMPARWILRYLIGMSLLQALILSSSYSGGLASIMTIPRYKRAILSVQDLADSNLYWGATSDAYLYALNDVNYGAYSKIKTTFRAHSVNELTEIAKSYNYAFLVERLQSGYFYIGDFIKRDVIYGYRIMRDDIYWDECIFVMRKHAVQLQLIDDLILKIFEAGLEAYWENQVVALHMDFLIQRTLQYYRHRNRINDHEPVKLQWQHVQGSFGIFFVGLSLATLCFIGEIIIYRYQKTTKKTSSEIKSS